jgi:hypothetical protein
MSNEDLTNEGLTIHLKYIREELADMKLLLGEFKDSYVTKEEFKPIKNLVYGFTGLILTSVTLAIIYLVIK